MVNSVAWGGTQEYEREKDKEKSLNIPEEDLRGPQKILNCRKGSLGATYNKKSEANTKVYDLNHKDNASPWCMLHLKKRRGKHGNREF